MTRRIPRTPKRPPAWSARRKTQAEFEREAEEQRRRLLVLGESTDDDIQF